MSHKFLYRLLSNRKRKRMKCRTLNNDLFLYAEGRLPQDKREYLESHLKECSGCREYLAFLRKSMIIIEKDREVEHNPFLYSRVVSKLESPDNYQWIYIKRLIPSMAFIVLLVVGVLGGINIGRLYSGTDIYSNELKEEIMYLDDIKQESIETFFLTSNDEEDE
jgi:predicted anti-sigma-YlaC factor YlaD